jgi:uncharacterized protein (TIGR03435 family)
MPEVIPRNMSFRRWLPLILVSFFAAMSAIAQTNDMGTLPVKGKSWTFEVVSIRPSQGGGGQKFGPTPNGYQMRNLFMVMPILTAYVPGSGAGMYTGDQLVGFPDWVSNEKYDIDAKVSEADLADWQNPKLQLEMLRSMLQAMLTERLKLAVHRGTKDSTVYHLVVGKGGPKFKETKPGEEHTGMKVDGGGVLSPEMRDGVMTMHYFGFSMVMLAPFLSDMVGRPVVDKTGLASKYDFALTKPIADSSDSGPSAFTVVQEQLGLKLEPVKGQMETIVIDHVEKPTVN